MCRTATGTQHLRYRHRAASHVWRKCVARLERHRCRSHAQGDVPSYEARAKLQIEQLEPGNPRRPRTTLSYNSLGFHFGSRTSPDDGNGVRHRRAGPGAGLTPSTICAPTSNGAQRAHGARHDGSL